MNRTRRTVRYPFKIPIFFTELSGTGNTGANAPGIQKALPNEPQSYMFSSLHLLSTSCVPSGAPPRPLSVLALSPPDFCRVSYFRFVPPHAPLDTASSRSPPMPFHPFSATPSHLIPACHLVTFFRTAVFTVTGNLFPRFDPHVVLLLQFIMSFCFNWVPDQFCSQNCISRRFSTFKCFRSFNHLCFFQLLHQLRLLFPCLSCIF